MVRKGAVGAFAIADTDADVATPVADTQPAAEASVAALTAEPSNSRREIVIRPTPFAVCFYLNRWRTSAFDMIPIPNRTTSKQ
jgi:hypothetical protein